MPRARQHEPDPNPNTQQDPNALHDPSTSLT